MISAKVLIMLTILVYLGGMIIIGIYCSKKNENVGDFYLKKNLFLLFAVFCFFHTKTVQKNRHHAFCVLAKGIIPVADAPVINQRTLTERIRLYNFVHGNIL